uniref:Uncharacterized protein LOC104250113 n=1 Tax=Nicotiana sylvestris TaxID=4096 RepID=A0A1U7YSQ9_NICSY|nr:PREDICTED: uncharacterized protein LOC104250113 [Nicotiana sylvestris]
MVGPELPLKYQNWYINARQNKIPSLKIGALATYFVCRKKKNGLSFSQKKTLRNQPLCLFFSSNHPLIFPDALLHQLFSNLHFRKRNETISKIPHALVKKAFYWDSLIDREVKRLWGSKAARRYCDFMCNIKKEKDIVQPDFVPKDVWDNWMELWKDPKCVKKSAKNRCGGGTAVAIGTHTGGSVTIGEHRKTCKYILRKG